MPELHWRSAAGCCARCNKPFAADAVLHMIMLRVICQTVGEAFAIYDTQASPVCEACLEPREVAERWVERTCGGCGHVMRYNLKPWGPHRPCRPRAWCSSRCEQRVRRVRNKVVQEKTCACCQKPFFPARADAVYCSSACRQWSYRAKSR
jgi:hypothetical protein